MMWLVSGSNSFLLPSLLPLTFGVDAGHLYAVLPERSVGKLA
jgi:hypothetical protein